MSKKTQFASKIGLIAATVGSAIGLGNVWRFPAETQANGGAAFLLLYVGCVLVLGIPVMLAEFSLGRAGHSDAVGAFKNLKARRGWWIVGGLAILASYLILTYYMVVAGWTLEYLFETLTGSLYSSADAAAGNLQAQYAGKMEAFICSDFEPLVFTWIVTGINICILLGGVQKGIERLSNVLMPLLFVILAGLICVTLSLPGAGKGVEFFLAPDFSKITPEVFVSALGQAFFSLSLGMGILITYASYYPADTRLTRTSVIVALLSLLVAVMMGMIIFPAVKSFGLDVRRVARFGPRARVRDAARGFRTHAALVTLVGAVLHPAFRGRDYLHGVHRRSVDSLPSGPLQHEPTPRLPHGHAADTRSERPQLAFIRLAQQFHNLRHDDF